jgi:hypothetical protein
MIDYLGKIGGELRFPKGFCEITENGYGELIPRYRFPGILVGGVILSSGITPGISLRQIRT